MKHSIKKIIALILSALMLLSTLNMGVFALGYGAEWGGYLDVNTQKYSDVPDTHWAFDSINKVADKGWFSGYPDGSFKPNASISRAEALKVFVVFLGLDYQSVDLNNLTYSDVKATDWFAPYVEAGKQLFPVHTTIQGKVPFNPNMPVTREDTIYALVKALGCDVDVKYPDQSVLNMFSDAGSISGNVKEVFTVALMHQLVAGYNDGTIRAQAPLTRAEFATLLLRGTDHGFHNVYKAEIASVTVMPASPIELEIGESVTLTARATYTDGSNKEYTKLQPYDSLGNGVIALSGTTITGIKDGTAEIRYNDSYLKNETLQVIVKKPSDAPKIKVTDYPETTEDSRVAISGTVIDKNVTTVDFTCNGKDIILNADGSFSTIVSLKPGNNSIKFHAVNEYKVSEEKTIEVMRTTAPVIFITKYDKRTATEKTIVEGIITDTDLSTVKLTCNDKNVSINKDGSFIAEVDLSIGKNSLKFSAINHFERTSEQQIEIERYELAEDPILSITKYKKRTTSVKTKVEGMVADKYLDSIKLTCNDKDIDIDKDGKFVVEVNLKVGKNSFTFTVINKYERTAEQKIEIIRYEVEEEEYKPDDESGEIIDLPDAEKTVGKVELTFVIDATGSMWDEIGNVKTNIGEFAEHLEEKGVDLKMSVVEYRDITCDEPTKVHKYEGSTWHTDAESLISTLASIIADGGGDGPESTIDAFGHVLDNRHMDWSPDAFKFAVLLTDADYKTESIYSYSSLEEIADKLASKNLNTSVITSTYYFGQYEILNSKTGGLQIDITTDFDKALSDLADKIIDKSKVDE